MTLDRFYPVMDSADWIARLLPVGITLVQLRVKDRGLDEVRNEVRAAKQICAQHKADLVINDYWEIAIEEECSFVHLGQEDLDGADLDAIRRAGMRLGVSTHDDDELERVLGLDPDYIALGPIYPTRLKKMKWHQQGPERLTEWKRRVGDVPLVGIGGISVERVPIVFAAGADIAAVVTDITLNPNPVQRARQWMEITR